MQEKKSKNLCEALRIMQTRGERRTLPRRSANLRLGMATSRSFEKESVFEVSLGRTHLKTAIWDGDGR
jgi:hypothetical protein